MTGGRLVCAALMTPINSIQKTKADVLTAERGRRQPEKQRSGSIHSQSSVWSIAWGGRVQWNEEYHRDKETNRWFNREMIQPAVNPSGTLLGELIETRESQKWPVHLTAARTVFKSLSGRTLKLFANQIQNPFVDVFKPGHVKERGVSHVLSTRSRA